MFDKPRPHRQRQKRVSKHLFTEARMGATFFSARGHNVSLAIFDLDNTLLSIDSDHAWGEFLLEQGAVDPVAYREANDRFKADYDAGCLDMMAFLEVALK